MVNNIVSELELAKAKVSELEAVMAKERRARLVNLHKELGFESSKELIAALRKAPAGESRPAASAGKRPRGKRSRITPEMKQELKALVNDGKTGKQIAKQLGISLPSVQNIKKELGLVNSRSKK